MIDLDKERELFLYSKLIRGTIQFDTYEYDEFLMGFKDKILNFMWHAWLASVNREGYKLIPIEPTEEMLLQVETPNLYKFEVPCGYENVGVDAETARDIYKDMVEAYK